MTRKLYFGTRGFMQEVEMPAIDVDASSYGYSAKSQYLNGGAGIRRSRGSHKEYVFSWNLTSLTNLRPILDFADGVYDISTEKCLLYFHLPGTELHNVLSKLWANPAQAIADGLTLFTGQIGTLVTTPTNALGYPARSAKWTLNTSSKTVWIPIPPGYTLWLGVHGTASSASSMVATPSTGLVDQAPVDLTILAVTDTTRVNASWASTAADGVTLSYKNLGAASTETASIAGVIAQILPTGDTPATGGFISGQGHSGVEFENQPNLSEYSAGLDKWGMSAKLTETGSWL